MRTWATLKRAKLWWLDDWVRASPISQVLRGLFPVSSGQSLLKVQGRTTSEPATGLWMSKAHWCTWEMMATPSGLILQKSYYSTSCWMDSCLNTHCSLLHMGLCSLRPVRVTMLTNVHHLKLLQWALGYLNWIVEHWKKVAWSDESLFFYTSCGRLGVCALFTCGRDGTRMHY